MQPMITQIQIQKNIPAPARRFLSSGFLPTVRATLQKMEIGDSFLWPISKTAYDAAKQLGYRITVRKESGNGFRVWLIAKDGTPQTLGGKVVQ